MRRCGGGGIIARLGMGICGEGGREGKDEEVERGEEGEERRGLEREVVEAVLWTEEVEEDREWRGGRGIRSGEVGLSMGWWTRGELRMDAKGGEVEPGLGRAPMSWVGRATPGSRWLTRSKMSGRWDDDPAETKRWHESQVYDVMRRACRWGGRVARRSSPFVWRGSTVDVEVVDSESDSGSSGVEDEEVEGECRGGEDRG